ncbi:MAG: acyl-CoA reductase [Flavobacteriaceae bacterium]|nr:acyl-CoA reductase [Flavobacteriaceae bacterium]
MDLRQKKINSIENLGYWLSGSSESKLFSNLQIKSEQKNGWFTQWNVNTAMSNWVNSLNKGDINKWLEGYSPVTNPKTVGLILAGNIPFVGLHDLLCVWLSGHKALVKLSQKDLYFLPSVVSFLEKECPEAKYQITFTDKKFEHFDAVIATGSDNSARYFDYYFSKVPNIIRKNRTGVAVLDGNETVEELEALGFDILAHYGLGCRNVSKIFIPKGYDLNNIFGGIYKYSNVMENIKYANNYDYNKAIFLMSEFKFLDNGFFLLKNDSSYHSPLACAFYSEYENMNIIENKLKNDADQIQCIVSKKSINNSFLLGQAQIPSLNDYADGINTLEFLSKL